MERLVLLPPGDTIGETQAKKCNLNSPAIVNALVEGSYEHDILYLLTVRHSILSIHHLSAKTIRDRRRPISRNRGWKNTRTFLAHHIPISGGGISIKFYFIHFTIAFLCSCARTFHELSSYYRDRCTSAHYHEHEPKIRTIRAKVNSQIWSQPTLVYISNL